VPDSNLPAELGPWAGADLAGTAATYAGEGVDDDIDPIRRFGRNVADSRFVVFGSTSA
jgi:hypothetical protein